MEGKKNFAISRIQEKSGSRIQLSSISKDRFQDNDELKYSLRSLDKCMPWIRNVYVITDDQCPEWVSKKNVIIIDHKDIFPKDDLLPTFNSHTIELCQHRINHLSECFISFNDDFIMGKQVRKRDFFTKRGEPIVWAVKFRKKHKARLLSENYSQMTPHLAGDTRARQMILKTYGLYMPFRVRHYPRGMKRSIMNEIWDRFPDEVYSTLSAQFRSINDVSIHALFSYFSIATGKGKLRVINGGRQIIDALLGRLRHMGATIGANNFEKKLKLIKRLKPLTICLNDGDGARENHYKAVNEFLKNLYPHASKYEKNKLAD